MYTNRRLQEGSSLLPQAYHSGDVRSLCIGIAKKRTEGKRKRTEAGVVCHAVCR